MMKAVMKKKNILVTIFRFIYLFILLFFKGKGTKGGNSQKNVIKVESFFT